MKYLPLREIDIINNAINFSTPDLHIIGTCDIYTTKAAGADKGLLYKIENELEQRYESLVRLSASLSPPRTSMPPEAGKETDAEQVKDKSLNPSFSTDYSEEIREHTNNNRIRKRTRRGTRSPPEINLSRDSPFGSLSKGHSRRVFAYLIATLNAAHPDYDFSNYLRPEDFKPVRRLRHLQSSINTALYNARPKQNMSAQYLALPSSHASMVAAHNELWSPAMWDLIDLHMELDKCEVYTYQPNVDPFDAEGEGSLWTMHHFFFNKDKKRVCYFHVRALSVISHSPINSHLTIKRKSSNISRSESAGKRADYWLGEKSSGVVDYDDEDYVMEDGYESSDDEYVDRIRYNDLDQVRNNISAGYWGMDGADDRGRGPGTLADHIGDSMDL